MVRTRMLCVWAGLVLLSAVGCQQETVQGPSGKALTLTTPSSVTIRRGGQRTVEMGIARKNTRADVTVSLSQLPSGVTVGESSRRVATDSVSFILKADPTAALVGGQAVTVTIEGPDGMRGTEHFRLSVVE